MPLITRTAWTDDDGSGSTGTVLNNAVKTELYNQIDAAIAGATGLWTPTDASGAGLTFTITSAYTTYTKVGALVHVVGNVTYPATANGATAAIGGLPYPCSLQQAGSIGYTTLGTADIRLWHDATNIGFLNSSAVPYTNAQLSGKQFVFALTYRTP